MPSWRSSVASVTGWASASHCRALSKSAWPPSASAILVSRVAIGAVAAIPAAVASTSSSKDSRVDHARDQADAQRLVGLDHAAGEQQVARVGRAHDVGQQVGAGHARVHARA